MIRRVGVLHCMFLTVYVHQHGTNLMQKSKSLWCKVYTNEIDYVIVGVCYRSQEADVQCLIV